MYYRDEFFIISELKKGNQQIFKEFYEENSPSLRYFASKYLQEDSSIDDIVQDSFVTFWENRNKLNTYNSAKSYLYTIVRNSCLNSIRHNSVKKKYLNTIRETDNSDSFLDNILEAEIFNLVMKFFNELPPACRNVYKLSISGLSHKDISEKLNISVNTVKKHKNLANHFIKEKISKVLELMLLVSI